MKSAHRRIALDQFRIGSVIIVQTNLEPCIIGQSIELTSEAPWRFLRMAYDRVTLSDRVKDKYSKKWLDDPDFFSRLEYWDSYRGRYCIEHKKMLVLFVPNYNNNNMEIPLAWIRKKLAKKIRIYIIFYRFDYDRRVVYGTSITS